MSKTARRALLLALALAMLAGCGQAAVPGPGAEDVPEAPPAVTTPEDRSEPEAPPSPAPQEPGEDVPAPGESEEMNVPNEPEEPDVPETPDVPDEPETPDVPEEPEDVTEPEPAPEPEPEPEPEPQPEPEPDEVENVEGEVPEELEDAGFTDAVYMVEVDIANEATAMAEAPAIPDYVKVSAPGTLEKRNAKAVIDYSNTADGYVMVQYLAATQKRLKALVKGPTTQYQYNITPNVWVSLPLSDGNGEYQIGIYENVQDSKYASVVAMKTTVTLTDEFAPFLRSNQYVDFEPAENTINKAAELCAGITEPLKKVEAVYNFVIKNMTYDKAKAASVQSGYLPVLDDVLEKKTGICFDYAALMTGMLRSQGVPCKLVVGYAGTAYHAWISVWSEADGWIEGAVYFNGTSWQRMDPTFASSGKQSESIMKYIGDGSNYSSKYFY